MSTLIENIDGDILALKKVCEFLKVECCNIEESNLIEGIKQACLMRFNRVMGIRFKYNEKSAYFTFFASIMGEAMCQHLNINVQIAPDKFRLIKYDGVNLVQAVRRMLEKYSVQEAFVLAFELLDKFIYLI